MIYKKNKFRIYGIQYKKLIFFTVIIVYFIGICSGSYFAFKNTGNLLFVQKVTVIQNLLQVEKTGNLGPSVRYLIRDVLLTASILLFKYSGVLKGVCVIIPFILAVQNSCIYASIICNNNISLFKLITNYIMKDTTISLLIILITTQTIIEIIANRYDIKADIKKIAWYYLSVIFVYVINFSVNYMI